MATNVIPFSAGLPAHLAKGKNRIDDMLAGGGGGFPKLSIKGKVFAVVRGGERKTVPNPKDPDSPASYLELVVLRAQKGMAKSYYAKAFSDDQGENVAPDCKSSDGEKPDADSKTPQCKTCAACKHNVFGTALKNDGSAAGGKRCQDVKRLAVASPSHLEEPMLLQVPPGSLKALTIYTKELKSRGVVDPAAAVTRVSFDMDQASPMLQFKLVGYLDEATYAAAEKQYDTDVVQQIVGAIAVPPGEEEFETPKAEAPKPEPVVTVPEEVVEAAKAEAPVEPVKPKAEAKPKAETKKPEPVVEIDDDISKSLDALLAGFDD